MSARISLSLILVWIVVTAGCTPESSDKRASMKHEAKYAESAIPAAASDMSYDSPIADYRFSTHSAEGDVPFAGEKHSMPIGGFPGGGGMPGGFPGGAAKSSNKSMRYPGAADSVSSPKDQTLPSGIGGAGAQEPAAAQRKLIQNFQLEVAVKNLDEAEDQLRVLIQSSGGFVSQSDRGSQPGQRRQGRWTIRVPGNRAGDTAKEIMQLGEPIRQSSKSQDVTEEFFDIEARLKNKRIEEERLLKHLKDSTGKLEEILTVEREIARVRGEVEQAQGRLNLLANLTGLATLQVVLAEHIDYKPEAAPTFYTRIERTFSQSFGGVTEFLESITLFLVALIPWIPVILVVCLLAVLGIRRGMKSLPFVNAPK